MSSIACSAVSIQTSPQSVPSTPSWMGEVAVMAHYLIHLASRLRLVFHPIWTPRASVFGPISKTLIVISDSQHRVFRFGIIHLMREIARFFCACAPVVGLINEVANHSPACLCCNFVAAEQENRSAI